MAGNPEDGHTMSWPSDACQESSCLTSVDAKVPLLNQVFPPESLGQEMGGGVKGSF